MSEPLPENPQEGKIYDVTERAKLEHPDDVAAGIADAAGLIDAISSHQSATDASELWTDERKLPGFGERYESCGEPFARFCADCGEVSKWGQTCKRKTCPRCAPVWARELATDWCGQLEQVRRVRAVQEKDHQRFHHVVISPPADFQPQSKEKWEKGAEICREMLERAGLEGFVIYHPYRGQDEDENDLGQWKERVFGGTGWNELLDEELRFNPHYHAVVCGHQVPGGGVTRAVESATGWVVHRITKKDSSVSLYDEYDLARAVTYCLSHAGYYETEQGTRVCHKRVGEKLKPGGGLSWKPDGNEKDAKLRRQYDAVTRSVSSKTLGLEYNDMACSADKSNDHDHEESEKVDLDLVQGRAREHSSGSSDADPSGEGTRDDLPEPPTGAGTWDDLDADDLRTLSDDDLPAGYDRDALAELLDQEDAENERCNGRLLSIAKAPRYLDNPEWRAGASHAQLLEEEYEEWRDRLDWLG